VVERQFGPSAQGVAFDVYFVAHGRDHNVTEDEVRTAWDNAFGRIGAELFLATNQLEPECCTAVAIEIALIVPHEVN
jgi:hypothetical protein